MRATCERVGAELRLALADVPAAHGDAVAGLAFAREDDRWVKRFAGDNRHADEACAHFPQHAEELVLQAAGERPVPWERALRELLRRPAARRIDWWLGGSAALAVRGLEITPRDLDVVTDEPGVHALADLLADELVEPLARSSAWIADWWTRAFLHARIDCVGAVHSHVDEPEPVDFGPAAARRLDSVRWNGFEIRVPPLDLQLRTCERRGLHERAGLIRAAG